MRRVLEIPLPSERHLPGLGSPRPEVAMPEPTALDLASWRDHQGLAFGFDLWERGFYWEAHEVWESAWKLTGEGAERELLRGLIQLAAARLQDELGKVDGAARLRERAAGHLRRAADQAGRPIVCGVWVDDAIERGRLRWRTRTRDLPAARTDLMTQPLECAFEIGDGAIIMRTEYAGYYSGNAYYADRVDDVNAARAAAERELAPTRPSYVNLEWEVEQPGPADFEPREGDTVSRIAVLAGAELAKSPAKPEGVEIRQLETDRDWALATAFHARLGVIDWGPDGRKFSEWRVPHYRLTAELRGGGFFAGIVEGEVIGSLGIVDCGDWFRYQDVQVAPKFRRRGIASYLCAEAFRQVGAGVGKPAIIAADHESVAEGMYRQLGFDYVSTYHGVRWQLDT